MRSFPSLLNLGCARSSTMNTRSDGTTLRASLPFSGKVIFVPFFHPGLMSIERISSRFVGLLYTQKKRNVLSKQDRKIMRLVSHPAPVSQINTCQSYKQTYGVSQQGQTNKLHLYRDVLSCVCFTKHHVAAIFKISSEANLSQPIPFLSNWPCHIMITILLKGKHMMGV